MQFLKEHGMLPLLEEEVPEGINCVFAGLLTDMQEVVQKVFLEQSLDSNKQFLPHFVPGGAYHVIFEIASILPQCIALDSTIGVNEVNKIASFLRQQESTQDAVLIAFVQSGEEVDHSLFHDVFRSPFDVNLVRHRVVSLVSASKVTDNSRLTQLLQNV